MPRSFWNDGQEIVQGDLNAIAGRLSMEVVDRLIYEIMGRQQNLVFGNSFYVSYVNSTQVSVAAGNGLYYDNTQVDPEPMNRLLYLPTASTQTISTPNGSQNRIDVVSIAPAIASISTALRNFKNATTGVVSQVSLEVEADWLSTLTITAGTPGGSPVAPATPAGNIALAQLAVTSVTGIANQAAITDVRPRFIYGNTKKQIQTVTSFPYTVDADDYLIKANCNGGAGTINLLPASNYTNREVTILKVDSSANALTIAPNGTDNIDGANATQIINNQFTSIRLWSDGSAYYIL